MVIISKHVKREKALNKAITPHSRKIMLIVKNRYALLDLEMPPPLGEVKGGGGASAPPSAKKREVPWTPC